MYVGRYKVEGLGLREMKWKPETLGPFKGSDRDYVGIEQWRINRKVREKLLFMPQVSVDGYRGSTGLHGVT